jgi:hypothetical protein
MNENQTLPMTIDKQVFNVPIYVAIYIKDLEARLAAPSPFSGGTNFMVGMDSLLRQCEAFDGGKIKTESVREYILSFQPKGSIQDVSIIAST